MSQVFFFYTVCLIGLALVVSSVSIMVWLMTERRDCVVAAIGFLLYALDIMLIFFDEYSRGKYSYLDAFHEPLTHPIPSFSLGIAILTCLWLFTLQRTHVKVTFKRVAAFVVPISMILLPLLPRSGSSGIVQQYLYWLVRDLGIVVCLVWAARCYKTTSVRAIRFDMGRSKRFFFVALLLTFCIIAEDTLMILFVRPSEENILVNSFLWHLQERNLSENALMIVSAVFLIARYRQILAVYARHPRSNDLDEGPIAVNEEDISTKIALFSEAFGLSSREADVLRLAVRGHDARGIANELVISIGTVKAHLHRIYSKAHVKSREGLLQEFWRQ